MEQVKKKKKKAADRFTVKVYEQEILENQNVRHFTSINLPLTVTVQRTKKTCSAGHLKSHGSFRTQK